MAEIVEAHRRHIPQLLQVPSSQDIEKNYNKIRQLDVSNCRANRPEDEVYVKRKIDQFSSTAIFNRELQKLIAGIAFEGMHMRLQAWSLECEEVKAELARVRRENEQLKSERGETPVVAPPAAPAAALPAAQPAAPPRPNADMCTIS